MTNQQPTPRLRPQSQPRVRAGQDADARLRPRQASPDQSRASRAKVSHERSRERAQAAKQRVQEASEQPIVIFGHPMHKAEVFKLWGLLAFIALMVVVTVLLWPYLGQLFSSAGREELVTSIRAAGPLGIVMLLGLQFLQIIVAFIPGEVVQMAAGAIYGPWLGAFVILAGCLLSSWFVYEVVHRLGQPFVEAMVPTTYLDRFRNFEEAGKLAPLVAVLFLIPGLPKDVFTYLVPLTNMPRKLFLAITTLARIPGVVMSTWAASGLMDGNLRSSIAMLVVLAVVAGVAYLFKDRMFERFGRR